MTEPIRKFAGQYRFLSNFYPAPVVLNFTHEGERKIFPMPSVENAYQAAKINPELPNRIALTKGFQDMTAGEAKRAGNRVPRRHDFDNIRIAVMYQLLVQKFKLGNLRAMLLSTGDAE